MVALIFKALGYFFMGVLLYLGTKKNQLELQAKSASAFVRSISNVEPNQKQNSDNHSKNSWENLPCLADSDAQRLFDLVHLKKIDEKLGGEFCALGYNGKLARVLSLMEKTKWTAPASWPEVIRSDLNQPLFMLSRLLKEIKLDLNQDSSVAYVKPTEKTMHLGKKFFSATPLDAISVLIHEARHADPIAPSHTTCQSGDLPLSEGACDNELSLENAKAGAYTYGTLVYFLISRLETQFNEGDRNYARNEGLLLVGTRFNNLPDILAKKQDQLAILLENGEIKKIDLSKLTFSEGLLEQETIEIKGLLTDLISEKKSIGISNRIEFDPSQGGLLIFDINQNLYRWSPRKGISVPFEGLYGEKVNYFEVSRLRIPFLPHTLFTMFTSKGLHYQDYDVVNDKRVLLPYKLNFPKQSRPVPQFYRHFLALLGESIFLDKTGEIFLAPHFGGEDAFQSLPEIQRKFVGGKGLGWKFGTGGSLYDTLLLLDENGEHFSVELKFVDSLEAESVVLRKYELKKSNLFAESREQNRNWKKINIGNRYIAALDSEGSLFLAEVPGKKMKLLSLDQKVKDMQLFFESIAKF